MGTGLLDQPVEWLLFSEFSVVLAFVHLYTMFMLVPIFNSMMRIDPALLEAAANAVVLLAVVLMIIAALTRLVDLRK